MPDAVILAAQAQKRSRRFIRLVFVSALLLAVGIVLLSILLLEIYHSSERKESRDDCYQKFTNRVSDIGADYQVSFGEAVLMNYFVSRGLATEEDVTVAIEIVQDNSVRYKEAVADRVEYDEAGRPLPCPIPSRD